MHDEMSAGLVDATKDKEDAIKAYEGLMTVKIKEVNALTAQIEVEVKRVGERGVENAVAANDLEDTKASLAEDKKRFLLELEEGCTTKTQEWEEIKKTRVEELGALADTIKVLNDDDGLELFKKTLPSSGASIMEISVRTASTKQHALSSLHAIKQSTHRPQLDLIELALHCKQMGFDQVIGMIDEMVAVLKKEQADDDSKEEYCEKSLDQTDDKKKDLELSMT